MLTSIIRIFILLGLFFSSLSSAISYTDNGDGTVTDASNGLTWMRCSMGQTWDGTTCTGTASTYTWAAATALTYTFAGQNDWRLPNIRELQTITDKTQSNPAIDTTAFPNTPSSYFWSGSSYVASPASAWGVGFGDGSSGASLRRATATSGWCAADSLLPFCPRRVQMPIIPITGMER